MPTILAVDDSEVIRQLVTFSLKAAGYDTAEADSGPAAFKMIEEVHPDLMILDVMMPGMSGFEVLNEMRIRYPELDLPVILLTAKTELTDKMEGFEAGAEDYLTKPFAPKELVMRVAAHLRSKEMREMLRDKNRGLEQLSSTDELTGLYNRRHLMQRVGEELSESKRHKRPVSLIIFDIDHFKNVNDTYGHPAGDDLLRGLAQTLTAGIRKEDIAARYGGEEFVLLMPSTPPDLAVGLAERLRQTVADTQFICGEHTINVTISIGVSGMPNDAIEVSEDLIDTADKRLYVAKNTGRNRVVGPEWEDEEQKAA